MSSESAIEWTDGTVNFWRGCHKVTPGCAHCYMFRDQTRYGRNPNVVARCADGTFFAPLRSRRWRERAKRIEDEQGRRMRVFTCSWSDFFIEEADPWREEAWDVIRACPEYDWQILTKRPELVRERLPADWGDGWEHVWLGVSIENRRYVHRADTLRALPAAVRFLSAEPLLGPLVHDDEYDGDGHPSTGGTCWHDGADLPELSLDGIDWMIVGGESGPRARPMRREWVRGLRDLCLAERWGEHGYDESLSGTAFLFKQWGGPKPGGARELDGRTWSEFPRSPARG